MGVHNYLMILLLLCSVTSIQDTNPRCREHCGDISVPYPFGIGSRDCALNDDFFLNCSSSGDRHELLFRDNMVVRHMSILEGTMTVSIYAAYLCDYEPDQWLSYKDYLYMDLGLGPYVLSDNFNIFTVIGCAVASIENNELTHWLICNSSCAQNVNTSDKNSCASGSGCCQNSIPKGLKSLNITLIGTDNHTYPCGYAFLADKRSINLSDWRLSRVPNRNYTSDVVIEWVAKNETCEQARADARTYACGSNSNCTFSENGQGYRCLCNEGFEGNPYLEHGCQDIDECNSPQIYPCKGRCENTIGSYICHCPLGMRGDSIGGCQGFNILTNVAAIGATVICLVIIGLLLCMICKKKRRDRNFKENGGIFLKHQRVKIFSKAELKKATNNYDDDHKLGEGGYGCVYRGVLSDNTLVAVKKSKGMDKGQKNEGFQHEIAIVLLVNHKNVVKLLGLCLETKIPLLVYEFIPNGTLFEHIHDKRSQILTTWINCLRIASEIALALDYLHSLADPPVIHGDIKSMNILLDSSYTAKISDFGASVLISPCQQNNTTTRIQGTFGYLDPEYLTTGDLTAKSDVYSFGVVLLELLTREKPVSTTRTGEKHSLIQDFISALRSNDLFSVLGFQTATEDEIDEIKLVADLAKRCVDSRGINRPTMNEVSLELGRLMARHDIPWDSKDNYKTEHLRSNSTHSISQKHLLSDSTHSFSKNASSFAVSQSLDCRRVKSFQIDNHIGSI